MEEQLCLPLVIPEKKKDIPISTCGKCRFIYKHEYGKMLYCSKQYDSRTTYCNKKIKSRDPSCIWFKQRKIKSVDIEK